MVVSSLWVFPLKGGAGIPVSDWPLDSFGLLHDRRWMVIDGDGVFVTQRSDPSLGQVRPAIDGESLVLQSATGECRIPLTPGGADTARVRVWADEVDAIDCGDDAAAFISRHLGRSARIVHMPDSTLRPVDAAYAGEGGRVSFADAFPLLIIGDGSLDELNGRLEAPIEMIRFRPNIVVSGVAPHGEDAWRRVRIGEVECDVVRACARCMVPTIDPGTGTAGREPTRTLAGYRRWDGKVWFGQNAIHRSGGTLHTGATVHVLEAGDPEPPLLL
jgi:uncharacterized protein YcbX